jgi:hypothetical protein
VKRRMIQNLHSRATTTCQGSQGRLKKSATWEVTSSSTVIHKFSSTRSLILRVAVVWTKSRSLWVVYIPHVKGVSEKFWRVGNQYNIRRMS